METLRLPVSSPVHGATRADAQLRPGAGQEVGEPVHDGGGHRQGSDVLVDLLQLGDDGASHQLQHVVREVEGHRRPLCSGRASRGRETACRGHTRRPPEAGRLTLATL